VRARTQGEPVGCEADTFELPTRVTDNVERKPRAGARIVDLVLNVRATNLSTAELAGNATAVAGTDLVRKKGGKPSSFNVLSRHGAEPCLRQTRSKRHSSSRCLAAFMRPPQHGA
jgi:hypothetical protein